MLICIVCICVYIYIYTYIHMTVSMACAFCTNMRIHLCIHCYITDSGYIPMQCSNLIRSSCWLSLCCTSAPNRLLPRLEELNYVDTKHPNLCDFTLRICACLRQCGCVCTILHIRLRRACAPVMMHLVYMRTCEYRVRAFLYTCVQVQAKTGSNEECNHRYCCRAISACLLNRNLHATFRSFGEGKNQQLAYSVMCPAPSSFTHLHVHVYSCTCVCRRKYVCVAYLGAHVPGILLFLFEMVSHVYVCIMNVARPVFAFSFLGHAPLFACKNAKLLKYVNNRCRRGEWSPMRRQERPYVWWFQ
jgi:hypothetical protein